MVINMYFSYGEAELAYLRYASLEAEISLCNRYNNGVKRSYSFFSTIRC